MHIEEIRSNESVKYFIELVNKYCSIIENRNEITRKDLFDRITPIIHQLLLTIVKLPDVSSFIEDINISTIVEEYVRNREKVFPAYLGFATYVSNDEWLTIFTELRQKIGENDRHDNCNEEEFRKYRKYNISLRGSLSDDLSDIYRDLKSRIILYDLQCPELLIYAIFEWGDVYIDHLISHLCGAICGLLKIK
jgi:hypothetical protein